MKLRPLPRPSDNKSQTVPWGGWGRGPLEALKLRGSPLRGRGPTLSPPDSEPGFPEHTACSQGAAGSRWGIKGASQERVGRLPPGPEAL